MSVSIRVYPNKLDSSLFEECQCDSGVTISEWLSSAVPAYCERESPLMSMELNGVEIEPEFWPITVLQSGNQLDIHVEPKDPVTVTLTVIAVVSAAAAIHYANQSIPDTYNSTVPKGSPVYSVNAQGNQPRLMGVVPEVFGRHKVFPDYLNQVRRTFINNEEYLYMMLCIGIGEYDIDPSEIYIGDTPASNYGSDIDFEIFSPGQSVAHNDASKNVYSNKEVGGNDGQSGLELKSIVDWDPYRYPLWGRRGSLNMLSTQDQWDNDGALVTDFYALPGVNNGDYIRVWGSQNANWDGVYKVINAAAQHPGTTIAATQVAKVDPLTFQVVATNNLWTDIPSNETGIGGGKRIGGKYSKARASDAVGPYSVPPTGQTTDKIYLDFRFNEGLGQVHSQGVYNHTVDFEIYWRESGQSSYEIIRKSYTNNTLDQLAYTIEISLPSKKNIEVFVVRSTASNSDVAYKEKVEWTALRCELPSATSYSDVTTMALRVKASNVLASAAENKVNLIATRHLPTWSGNFFGAIAPTKDIAPTVKYLADRCELPVDMDELKRLHDIWSARGDEFNGVFDNPTTAWEALKRILAVGFAEPTLDFGQLVPVRDEQRSTIEHMYMPQNILPNSWKMNATLFDASEPDGVEVEYMDGSGGTWKSETIMCTLPGEAGENPEKVRAYGITDRTKAYQFGMRKRSAIRYRRKQHKFATEMDGLNSNYLSYDGLAIQSPSFSQTGELLSYENNKLVLSEPVIFSAGTHYIALRKPDGTASGPYECVKGDQDNEVIISQSLDFNPVMNGRQEPPFFMFGVASEWCERVLIQDIQPSGTDRVNLTAISDDPRVYAYDDAVAPN